MLFRGNVLVDYDFDTEGSDFDEMVKNGTLVFSEERDDCFKGIRKSNETLYRHAFGRRPVSRGLRRLRQGRQEGFIRKGCQ